MAHEVEGVIKFAAAHEERALSAQRYGELVARLAAWREILCGLGLVGQDPARYDGAGFGNVSGRVGPFPGERGRRAFVITGTQTGGHRCVSLADFCVVRDWDAERNRVTSAGPVLPSSEALTHAALYDLAPHVRFVLHVHAPALWAARVSLRLPTTSERVAYGTPEMAREVQRLWRESSLAQGGVLAMGGHEDGVIAFGKTPDDAGRALIGQLAQAYEAVLKARGELCHAS